MVTTVGTAKMGGVALCFAVLALLAEPAAAFALAVPASVSRPAVTAAAATRSLPSSVSLAATTTLFSEPTNTKKASAPTTTSDDGNAPKDDAQELLQLLLTKYQTKQPNTEDDRQRIGEYITRLSRAQVSFDPTDCLNGTLYAVLHQQGPKVPLWEKIGIFRPSRNVKGQQFVYNNAEPPQTAFEIVNYAEVWGRGMF